MKKLQPSLTFEVDFPPQQRVPLVLNSPHSGRAYPADFLAASRLTPLFLRRSEDAYVDEIFAFGPNMGIPLLKAHFPRAFLDVNREPFELDPAMFDGPLPAEANSRSLRVAGGLGTIPRVVGEGQPIYSGVLPLSEINRRINGLYRPYHRELAGLLDETHRNFGQVVLIDCHSMPSQPFTTPVPGYRRADIVLGDRFGTSCSAAITQNIEDSLRSAGLKVQRNKPYAGGYITEHYGHPGNECHAIQLEINRDLYMNEPTLEKKPAEFLALSATLSQMIERLSAMLASPQSEQGLAAE